MASEPFAAGPGDRFLELPSVDDVRPWFDAVCALWDDPEEYRVVSARARAEAVTRFAEPILQGRYLDYFAKIEKRQPLFFTDD